MSIHLADSQVYGHLWATDEARSILGEDARFAAWLDILAVLAEAQAAVGMVPAEAATAIRAFADTGTLDIAAVAEETRTTGHSTLGLIRTLKRRLPAEAAEWVYFGATVQDLTDTWTSLVMRRVADAVERDLARIEAAALDLARRHRDLPMLGRTHAQPGLPITFGFKAAVWVSEVSRHRSRLSDGRRRWELVQLGGGLGTMEFWGDDAIPLLEEFGRRLDLAVPDIAWITSRDGVAEFAGVLAMISSTVAKIGNEIMELQRMEIGEVREEFQLGTVGSITMPHKRNPELSEHLDTLARMVRADAAVVTEAMIQIHERDGRGWKAEWLAIPELCSLTMVGVDLGATLLEGLEVVPERMAANIAAQRGYVLSEPVMRALAGHLGKHTAHEVTYQAAMSGVDAGLSLPEALAADPRVTGHLDADQIAALFDVDGPSAAATVFVDRVISTAARNT